MRLYIDNVKAFENDDTNDIHFTTNSKFLIGALWSKKLDSIVALDGGTYSNDTLDQIRIYDRVLTETEITALYNEGI